MYLNLIGFINFGEIFIGKFPAGTRDVVHQLPLAVSCPLSNTNMHVSVDKYDIINFTTIKLKGRGVLFVDPGRTPIAYLKGL